MATEVVFGCDGDADPTDDDLDVRSDRELCRGFRG